MFPLEQLLQDFKLLESVLFSLTKGQGSMANRSIIILSPCYLLTYWLTGWLISSKDCNFKLSIDTNLRSIDRSAWEAILYLLWYPNNSYSHTYFDPFINRLLIIDCLAAFWMKYTVFSNINKSSVCISSCSEPRRGEPSRAERSVRISAYLATICLSFSIHLSIYLSFFLKRPTFNTYSSIMISK